MNQLVVLIRGLHNPRQTSLPAIKGLRFMGSGEYPNIRVLDGSPHASMMDDGLNHQLMTLNGNFSILDTMHHLMLSYFRR